MNDAPLKYSPRLLRTYLQERAKPLPVAAKRIFVHWNLEAMWKTFEPLLSSLPFWERIAQRRRNIQEGTTRLMAELYDQLVAAEATLEPEDHSALLAIIKLVDLLTTNDAVDAGLTTADFLFDYLRLTDFEGDLWTAQPILDELKKQSVALDAIEQGNTQEELLALRDPILAPEQLGT